MAFKEEEITREVLLKEFKRKEENKLFKTERCSICNGPSLVFMEIEGDLNDGIFYGIDSNKHDTCRKIAKYEKLSIFDKFHKENTFENAKITNDLEKMYLESFKKYCDNFENAKEEGVGILLTGNAGTGKTFYSNCISNELKSKGYSVLSFNISKYLQELRKGFDEKEKELLEAVETVDLIIIDDVGSEAISETWGKEKMFNLFNTIYLNKKSCIVTTNNNAKELGEHFKINGSEKILDRLLELCKPFKFDWKSRRAEIGQSKFKNYF